MAKEIAPERLVELGLQGSAAEEMARRLNSALASGEAAECWRTVSKEILSPDVPFEVHLALYETVFSDWDESAGPRPAWSPTDDYVRSTNIGALMDELGIGTYADLHAWSTAKREEFWDLMIRKVGIRFHKPYESVADLSGGVESPEWLPGAELNIAESCFAGDEDATAILYQAEGGELSSMTCGELDRLSNRVANGLVRAGFAPGDALACYMPMTAESVEIYLGIVKAGCVVVSVADSFAPAEVAKRLEISGAKGIFTQDVMLRGSKRLPLYEKVVAAGAPGGPRAVVLPGAGALDAELRDGDMSWSDFLSDDESFAAVSRDPHDHTNILFSSGTTGEPKAIPWTHTTPMKCAVDGWLHQDIRPGDVVSWPSNLGWMMGPWLIYASLVNRASMALYYGSPSGREFAEFVQDANVNMLGLVPSMVKAWRANNDTDGLDWSAIRCFSSTGECSNAEDYLWLMSRAGYKPVIEYCGGTEIGGGYITGTMVQAASPATFSTPSLGLDLYLIDEAGEAGDAGEVYLVPPSIGLSTELLNRDHREVYFDRAPAGPKGEVLRRHGDQIESLGGGFFRAQGRADDTMNLSGIKVSSAEIERAVTVEGLTETAAIAVPPPGGGPGRLVIYAVPEPGTEPEAEELKPRMQGEIKRRLNPLFRVHDVVVIDALPRTASNKVMRRTLRSEYGESGGGQ